MDGTTVPHPAGLVSAKVVTVDTTRRTNPSFVAETAGARVSLEHARERHATASVLVNLFHRATPIQITFRGCRLQPPSKTTFVGAPRSSKPSITASRAATSPWRLPTRTINRASNTASSSMVVPGAELIAGGRPTKGRRTWMCTLRLMTPSMTLAACSKIVSQSSADTPRSHEHQRRGRVTKLFSDKGYGFIETAEGDEIYFHRNSVLERGFEHVSLGVEVRFVDEVGEQGPQASSVTVRHKS